VFAFFDGGDVGGCMWRSGVIGDKSFVLTSIWVSRCISLSNFSIISSWRASRL